jgi:hypothetical protein
LTELGFEEAQVRKALELSQNDPEIATNLLLEGDVSEAGLQSMIGIMPGGQGQVIGFDQLDQQMQLQILQSLQSRPDMMAAIQQGQTVQVRIAPGNMVIAINLQMLAPFIQQAAQAVYGTRGFGPAAGASGAGAGTYAPGPGAYGAGAYAPGPGAYGAGTYGAGAGAYGQPGAPAPGRGPGLPGQYAGGYGDQPQLSPQEIEIQRGLQDLMRGFSEQEKQTIQQLCQEGYDPGTVLQIFNICDKDINQTRELLRSMS